LTLHIVRSFRKRTSATRSKSADFRTTRFDASFCSSSTASTARFSTFQYDALFSTLFHRVASKNDAKRRANSALSLLIKETEAENRPLGGVTFFKIETF
jgi:hypothetical protein